MENIAVVTEHLRKKIAARGGNPDRETLTVIKTREGKNFYKDSVRFGESTAAEDEKEAL